MVGSVLLAHSTMRRGWRKRMQAVCTRFVARTGSHEANSPEAMLQTIQRIRMKRPRHNGVLCRNKEKSTVARGSRASGIETRIQRSRTARPAFGLPTNDISFGSIRLMEIRFDSMRYFLVLITSRVVFIIYVAVHRFSV